MNKHFKLFSKVPKELDYSNTWDFQDKQPLRDTTEMYVEMLQGMMNDQLIISDIHGNSEKIHVGFANNIDMGFKRLWDDVAFYGKTHNAGEFFKGIIYANSTIKDIELTVSFMYMQLTKYIEINQYKNRREFLDE